MFGADPSRSSPNDVKIGADHAACRVLDVRFRDSELAFGAELAYQRTAMWRRKKKPKRRGYVRPSRAKPKAGWSLRELGQLSGLSPRTIRDYMRRGVVPRPPFKGPATRYQRRQLLLLLALRRLVETERLALTEVRARLQSFSPEQLESFATERLTPGPAATALGVRPPLAAPPSAASPSASHAARWARIELALGLELHVREDASESVLELANRLASVALAKP